MIVEPSLILVLSLSLVVGITLGALGGGGSILTVPILAYVAGMSPREAIASSLFVVGVTSLVSVFTHARKGNVRWRTGILFGIAAMAGGFLGGIAGGVIPGTILMIGFAIMMLATATAMIRGKRTEPLGTAPTTNHPQNHSLLRISLVGLAVGGVTGIVGAGGGFLVVPVLALLGGLSMSAAVGTSLLVIVMKSFAAFSGYLSFVDLDWGVILAVTISAVVGSFLGVPLATKIPERALRQSFGWFVLLMGAIVLAQEVPAPADIIILAATAIAGGTEGGRLLLRRHYRNQQKEHHARIRPHP